MHVQYSFPNYFQYLRKSHNFHSAPSTRPAARSRGWGVTKHDFVDWSRNLSKNRPIILWTVLFLSTICRLKSIGTLKSGSGHSNRTGHSFQKFLALNGIRRGSISITNWGEVYSIGQVLTKRGMVMIERNRYILPLINRQYSGILLIFWSKDENFTGNRGDQEKNP